MRGFGLTPLVVRGGLEGGHSFNLKRARVLADPRQKLERELIFGFHPSQFNRDLMPDLLF